MLLFFLNSKILLSYKTAPPPYAFGQGTRTVRILARVAQVYVVVQFYPMLKIAFFLFLGMVVLI